MQTPSASMVTTLPRRGRSSNAPTAVVDAFMPGAVPTCRSPVWLDWSGGEYAVQGATRNRDRLECPRCGFVMEVAIVDVVAQTYRWCPGCHGHIRLKDDGGSVAVSLQEIDAAIRSLSSCLS